MRRIGWIACAGLAVFSLGCSGGDAHHDHDGHDHGVEDATTGAEDAFSGLAAADQVLARAQGTCPVSSEELGSMGTPVRKEHEGTVVFLCCAACEQSFDADPASYAAQVAEGR